LQRSLLISTSLLQAADSDSGPEFR
jgi:hypothetical protein